MVTKKSEVWTCQKEDSNSGAIAGIVFLCPLPQSTLSTSDHPISWPAPPIISLSCHTLGVNARAACCLALMDVHFLNQTLRSISFNYSVNMTINKFVGWRHITSFAHNHSKGLLYPWSHNASCLCGLPCLHVHDNARSPGSISWIYDSVHPWFPPHPCWYQTLPQYAHGHAYPSFFTLFWPCLILVVFPFWMADWSDPKTTQ